MTTVTFDDDPPPPPNDSPIADAGADQNVTGSSTVNLGGSGSFDPDGSISSYAWTRISGPSVVLTDADTSTPSFTAPNQDTTITLRLTVTDNEGATDTDDVSIAVEAVMAPDRPSAPTLAVVSQTVIRSTFTDPNDGNSPITSRNLRYRETGTSAWTTQTNVMSPHDITGLTPDTTYEAQVRAINLVGSSPWSPTSSTAMTEDVLNVSPTISVSATPTTIRGALQQLEIVSISNPFFTLLDPTWNPSTSHPLSATHSVQGTGVQRYRITFNATIDVPLTHNMYLGISVPSQGLIGFLRVTRGQFQEMYGPTNSILLERPVDQFFPDLSEFDGEDITITLHTWSSMLEATNPVSQLGRIDVRTVGGDTNGDGGIISTNLPFLTQGNSEGEVTRVRVQGTRILLTPESGHSFATNALWWLVEDFSGIVIAAEELSPTASGTVNLDLPYQTGTHDFSIGVYDGNLQNLLDARVGGWDHPASYWS